MTSDALDMSAFWDEFKEEAQELTQKVTEGLLRLEQKPDDLETVQEIARAMHTLKGSARLMGLEKLNRLMHRLEDMLGAVKKGEFPFTPAAADLILQAVDLVPPAIDSARNTGNETIEVEGLCAAVDRIVAGTTAQPAPQIPAEPPPDPPQPPKAQPPEQTTPPAEPAPQPEKRSRKRRQTASRASVSSASAATAPQPTPAGSETRTASPPDVDQPPSASDASEPPEAPAARRAPPAETIRVDTRKLDSLANVTGEMVVNLLKFEAIAGSVREIFGGMKQHVRSWQQLRDEVGTVLAASRGGNGAGTGELVERCDDTGMSVLTELERLRQRLNEDIMRVATSTRKLQEDVMSIRMHPVSTLFNTFPRAVRDLARELGKSAQLVLEGGDTELDRKILEAIRDPMLHLVRNAVSHGIEPPPEREKIGKRPEGSIRLSAWQQGDQVFIQVSDDGRGIDPAGVRKAAVGKGLIDQPTADALSRDDCLRLIFEPGFSTSATINDISGRGVGMDVVKSSVEEMHGEVRVDSQVGSGTAVTLVLPLTLAISRALLVRSGERTFAIPTVSVETTTRAKRGEVKSVEGKEVIIVRGATVPILPLSRALGAQTRQRSGDEALRIVVISHSQHRFGFVVEELIGEQEIVVKPLGAPLRRVKNIAGAAILGGGEVVTVLHVPDLVAAARAAVLKQAPGERRGEQAAPRRKRVLVVEDSLTARELERSMFESGGYEVETAVDGADAMGKLTRRKPDLIVTDVQMPRMDGFELTARVRSDDRFRDIPVIIVTTRSDETNRQRGMEVGADAYLVKASLTQTELLECARRLAG